MKLSLSIGTLLIAAAFASAQEATQKIVPEAPGVARIHSVAPGSSGNVIALSLANNNGDLGSDSIMVWLNPFIGSQREGSSKKGVHVTPSMQVVPAPPMTGNTEVRFAFDVSRDVRLYEKDSLGFLIVGRGGPLLRKTILLSCNLPTTYQLDQNFPNPFNPSTTIYYQLPADSRVSLKIYDILGRQVNTLVSDQQVAGYYTIQWDATNSGGLKVSSGVYIYRIEASSVNGQGSFNNLKKMLLLK